MEQALLGSVVGLGLRFMFVKDDGREGVNGSGV